MAAYLSESVYFCSASSLPRQTQAGGMPCANSRGRPPISLGPCVATSMQHPAAVGAAAAAIRMQAGSHAWPFLSTQQIVVWRRRYGWPTGFPSLRGIFAAGLRLAGLQACRVGQSSLRYPRLLRTCMFIHTYIHIICMYSPYEVACCCSCCWLGSLLAALRGCGSVYQRGRRAAARCRLACVVVACVCVWPARLYVCVM